MLALKRRFRKKRRNGTIFLTVLIFILALGIGQLLEPEATTASEPVQVVTVIVKRGDSLWKIAERYDNNKIDLRKYIEIIQEYNGLDTTVLQPGQRISVPIYAAHL